MYVFQCMYVQYVYMYAQIVQCLFIYPLGEDHSLFFYMYKHTCF